MDQCAPKPKPHHAISESLPAIRPQMPHPLEAHALVVAPLIRIRAPSHDNHPGTQAAQHLYEDTVSECRITQHILLLPGAQVIFVR